MAVLSIQSHVAYGHVGNSAAVFALQSLGIETWPVNTVRFSNHPGHEEFRGAREDPSVIRDVLQGIGVRGVFRHCRGVLSGYLGHPSNGEVVLEAVAGVKSANPDCLFLCDPVFGDRDKGIYVADGLVGFYRDHALPACDVTTPNAFELEVLSGRSVDRPQTAAEAASSLLELGPNIVIVTSVPDGSGSIGNLLVTGDGVRHVTTPALETPVKGAGDLLAALWLGRFLLSGEATNALVKATASVFDLLEKAVETQAEELPLVAGRGSLTHPKTAVSVRHPLNGS